MPPFLIRLNSTMYTFTVRIMCIYIVFFIYRRSLLTYFTTLIYHNVLINNKTEQDTEQDTAYKHISGKVYVKWNECLSICLSLFEWLSRNVSGMITRLRNVSYNNQVIVFVFGNLLLYLTLMFVFLCICVPDNTSTVLYCTCLKLLV